MNEIRKEIGICPQFDIQWDTLTPYEHVIFYARLKGISKEHEKQHSVIILYFLLYFLVLNVFSLLVGFIRTSWFT